MGRETNLFLILKAFGAGVILATGFIHMFPDAASQFSNECLGKLHFNQSALCFLVFLCVTMHYSAPAVVHFVMAGKFYFNICPPKDVDVAEAHLWHFALHKGKCSRQ